MSVGFTVDSPPRLPSPSPPPPSPLPPAIQSSKYRDHLMIRQSFPANPGMNFDTIPSFFCFLGWGRALLGTLVKIPYAIRGLTQLHCARLGVAMAVASLTFQRDAKRARGQQRHATLSPLSLAPHERTQAQGTPKPIPCNEFRAARKLNPKS